MHIDKAHLALGFWVGLGLLFAYFLWNVATQIFGRVVHGGGRGSA